MGISFRSFGFEIPAKEDEFDGSSSTVDSLVGLLDFNTSTASSCTVSFKDSPSCASFHPGRGGVDDTAATEDDDDTIASCFRLELSLVSFNTVDGGGGVTIPAVEGVVVLVACSPFVCNGKELVEVLLTLVEFFLSQLLKSSLEDDCIGVELPADFVSLDNEFAAIAAAAAAGVLATDGSDAEIM